MRICSSCAESALTTFRFSASLRSIVIILGIVRWRILQTCMTSWLRSRGLSLLSILRLKMRSCFVSSLAFRVELWMTSSFP